MREHNKITFAKEYCLCRKIPYKFKGEQLTIGDMKTYNGSLSILSVYTYTYQELIDMIDYYTEYDAFGYYLRVNSLGTEKN